LGCCHCLGCCCCLGLHFIVCIAHAVVGPSVASNARRRIHQYTPTVS
jgi:hypothetical protein